MTSVSEVEGEGVGAAAEGPGMGRRGAGLAAASVAAVLMTAPGSAFAAGGAAALDSVVELTPDNFASEVEATSSGRAGRILLATS
jgi:hypothetical protein